MNDDQNSSEDSPVKQFKPGPAEDAHISLSQAILAPLDAISKAQIHSARSFLNFVLQVAFPHKPQSVQPDQSSTVAPAAAAGQTGRLAEQDHSIYMHEFRVGDGEVISIPSLAMIPVQPLSIDKASYDIELVVKSLDYHRQIQSSEEETLSKESGDQEAKNKGKHHADRKWYLVSDPVSVRGTLTDPGGEGSSIERQASVKVHVEISRTDTPLGLAKIINAATQSAGTKPKV